MLVEVFDAATPARVFRLQRGAESLAAIVDGSGSWGTGREAANLSRAHLESRWRSARGWSLSELQADIVEAAARTPETLRAEEFGWSYSVTVLLCSPALVEVLAAGLFRVDVLTRAGSEVLFRPRMLVDDLQAGAAHSEVDIVAFPHRDVCLGPFVGDEVPLATARHELGPDETIVVTHAARPNPVLSPPAAPPGSARALSALAVEFRDPGPVILVRA